jgi:hypothetical protein
VCAWACVCVRARARACVCVCRCSPCPSVYVAAVQCITLAFGNEHRRVLLSFLTFRGYAAIAIFALKGCAT